MKIIFLDFDGVLNNMSSLYLRTLNYDKNKPETHSVAAPNPVCVGLVEHLLRLSGAKIVVSSSWRGGYELKELAWCLFS